MDLSWPLTCLIFLCSRLRPVPTAFASTSCHEPAARLVPWPSLKSTYKMGALGLGSADNTKSYHLLRTRTV
eukprot:9484391-Pyramimonas_sp.AAC.1